MRFDALLYVIRATHIEGTVSALKDIDEIGHALRPVPRVHLPILLCRNAIEWHVMRISIFFRFMDDAVLVVWRTVQGVEAKRIAR